MFPLTENRRLRISKALIRILRHQEGLPRQNDGCVPVKVLMEMFPDVKDPVVLWNCCAPMIYQGVRQKERFIAWVSHSGYIRSIGAIQGFSARDVDLEMAAGRTKVFPRNGSCPHGIVHGTSESALRGILRSGIIPGGRSGTRKEVHFLQIRQEWTRSGEQSLAEEVLTWRQFKGATDDGRWVVRFELPDFEREIPGIRSRAEVLVFVDAEALAEEDHLYQTTGDAFVNVGTVRRDHIVLALRVSDGAILWRNYKTKVEPLLLRFAEQLSEDRHNLMANAVAADIAAKGTALPSRPLVLATQEGDADAGSLPVKGESGERSLAESTAKAKIESGRQLLAESASSAGPASVISTEEEVVFIKREEEFVPDFGDDPDNEAVKPARRAAILRLMTLEQEEQEEPPDPEILAKDERKEAPAPEVLEAPGGDEGAEDDSGRQLLAEERDKSTDPAIEVCVNCRAVKLAGYAWCGACGCRFFGAESATVVFITRRAVGFESGLKMVWTDRGGRTEDSATRRASLKRQKRAIQLGYATIVERWDGDEQFRTKMIGQGWTRESAIQHDEIAARPAQDPAWRSWDQRSRAEGTFYRNQARAAPGEIDPTRARTDNPTLEAEAAILRDARAERETAGQWWEERGWSDDYRGWVTRTSRWSRGGWR